jgi:hypothetical protein
MIAPVLSATALARVLLPAPGKPQKRIMIGKSFAIMGVTIV